MDSSTRGATREVRTGMTAVPAVVVPAARLPLTVRRPTSQEYLP